jgi:hypothetical protein
MRFPTGTIQIASMQGTGVVLHDGGGGGHSGGHGHGHGGQGQDGFLPSGDDGGGKGRGAKGLLFAVVLIAAFWIYLAISHH